MYVQLTVSYRFLRFVLIFHQLQRLALFFCQEAKRLCNITIANIVEREQILKSFCRNIPSVNWYIPLCFCHFLSFAAIGAIRRRNNRYEIIMQYTPSHSCIRTCVLLQSFSVLRYFCAVRELQLDVVDALITPAGTRDTIISYLYPAS